jgi:hypothetical protein
MASCAKCGAEGIAPEAACPRCGAANSPELELDLRARPAPKPVAAKKKAEPVLQIELGVDPSELQRTRSASQSGSFGTGPTSHAHTAPLPAHGMTPPPPGVHAAASAQIMRGVPTGKPAPSADPNDLGADAYALADFGEPPANLLLTPVYAWRVLKRQREIKAALAGRKAEADHAVTEVEEALVALADRVRATAATKPAYSVALEDLSRAEDMLRSRDNVLAAEQDAQKARLAQVDARLTKTENELIEAQTNERLAAQELASTQNALAREEAKLKRAESELKGQLQRTNAGGTG